MTLDAAQWGIEILFALPAKIHIAFLPANPRQRAGDGNDHLLFFGKTDIQAAAAIPVFPEILAGTLGILALFNLAGAVARVVFDALLQVLYEFRIRIDNHIMLHWERPPCCNGGGWLLSFALPTIWK